MRYFTLQKTEAGGQAEMKVIADTLDDPVMLACDEYFRLNKIWVDANPEGEIAPVVILNKSEYYRLSQKRRSILAEISRLAPAGNQSLLAKQRVFQDILQLEEPEGGEFVQFAVALVEDYRNIVFGGSSRKACGKCSFLLEDHIAFKEAPDKKRWKFNIKFLGIFSS